METEIKETFKGVIQLADSLATVLEDGKISLIELPALAIASSRIPSLVENAKKSLATFKKMTPSKAKELAIYFENEYDIANDEIEKQVEDGIHLLSNTYETGLAAFNLYRGWEAWMNNFEYLRSA